MIETFNDMLSIIVLVIIVLGSLYLAMRLDTMFKKNKDDDYYQDLL